jgi:cytochrome c oxidase subunit 3
MFSRFKFIETWPLADEVFTHFPFMHGVCMIICCINDFYFNFSSVTMVLPLMRSSNEKDKVVFICF